MSVSSDLIEMMQAGRFVLWLPIGPLSTGEPGFVAIQGDASILPTASLQERIAAAMPDGSHYEPSPCLPIDYMGVCDAAFDQVQKLGKPDLRAT